MAKFFVLCKHMWPALGMLAHVGAALVVFAVTARCKSAWDIGHTLLPAHPGLGGLKMAIECATLAMPGFVLWRTPKRARPVVVKHAMVSYIATVMLRSFGVLLTLWPSPICLPVSTLRLVLGVGHAHTSLIASFAFAAREYTTPTTTVACVLHTCALLSCRMYYSLDVFLSWLAAWLFRPRCDPVELSLVYSDDPTREEIYRARHEVYACELGQHPPNADAKLRDYTDAHNVYIIATRRGVLQGFIAITPPGFRKALQRHGVTPAHDASHELRLLTVLPGCRGQRIGSALMYAAARYVAASGGTHLEALARKEVASAYLRRGLSVVSNEPIQSGNVQFVHVQSTIEDAHATFPEGFAWNLPFGVSHTSACVHGGLHLESIQHHGVHADVLDAWFPPAPSVIRAVTDHPNDIRVTPPVKAHELIEALAVTRNLRPTHLLLGAGSSDLIYRCLWTWLSPESHVLLLHPTYGEYEHVVNTIGCQVTKLELDASNGYVLTPEHIPQGDFDMVILCNPNSPTGVWSDISTVIDKFPTRTRIWVDETYIDYIGSENSLEYLVGTRPNMVICKSMSKAYALSGLRVGYVYAHPSYLDAVRARSPPWSVSRTAQRAAIEALKSTAYYAERYAETHVLRHSLEEFLRKLGWYVVPNSCANFVMARLPSHITAQEIVSTCAKSAVYIRLIDDHTIRIAIKGHETQQRIMDALEEAVFLSML